VPIIKSAKKRVKIAAKARARNAKSKRTMREAIKAFTKSLDGGKPAEVIEAQRQAVSTVDQAVKKNLIHKNKAARIKSRLSAQAKAAGAKPVKTVAKKPVAKSTKPKPAARKTVAKKAPARRKPAKE
jgi:ribosomal protein S20